MSIGGLTQAELAKLAQEQVNEDPDRIADDIQMVKEWLEKQPHLQNICKGKYSKSKIFIASFQKDYYLDDQWIQFFLRGCKYSLERTKEKLDFFNSVRSALPDWFGQWDQNIDSVLDIVKAGGFILLNGYDKKGRRVFVFNLQDIDPVKFSNTYDLINIFYLMILEILMDSLDQCSVTGLVSGFMIEGITMAQVALYSNPVTVKKSAKVIQDAYPFRPQAMHMLNLPPLAETAVTLFKSCLSEKMKSRIKVGVLANFMEDTGAEILPEELGGTNGKLQDHVEYTCRMISDKRDWLKLRTELKSDEAKRVGQAKDYNEIFGMEGSFRKLNLD